MSGYERLKEKFLGKDRKRDDKNAIKFLYQCLLVLEKQNKEYHEQIVQMIAKVEEILNVM
jgi:hypothetical protein|nr:MAG TPA: hypothetical protein [Caudoviricetes sp.]